MAGPVLTDWKWQGIDIPPPRYVRCVFLEGTRTSTLTTGELCIREVVLVGYHTDLLRKDGWAVHELPGDLFTRQPSLEVPMAGGG